MFCDDFASRPGGGGIKTRGSIPIRMMMQKRIEIFIAQRYLLSNRAIRFVNVISIISIGGITIGVAALLVALSVFNGFNSVVSSVLVGFDPHLRIERRGNITSGQYDSLAEILGRVENITGYAPFVSGKGMLVAGSFNRVVFLRGVDERRISDVSGLKEKLVLGKLYLQDSARIGSIIIGLTLADRLGVVTGDELAIISPYGFQSMMTSLSTPEMVKFRVMGIFDSNNKEYDANYAFISIPVAQRLFNLDAHFSGIDIRIRDISGADNLKKELSARLPSDLVISTWYDLHKSLYDVMKIERWSAFVLLSLIIVVATFNMLGSLTMTVVEKKRDIAILKAMGMVTDRIIRIFMVEGMFIGIIGTVIGMILGSIILWLQVRYQLFPLDPTIYIIPAIPVEVRWFDFIAIGVSSLGLSFLAAYYPARRAANSSPSEALRWE
jgi:lipoprotein-releasing system permease protein